MDLVVFEQDKAFVLEAFRQGQFDYVEAASEVFESQFFRFLGSRGILKKLAQSYPTPRQKHEVPLWMYLGSNLSMRLHGVHRFHAYPYVVRCGGLLSVFGPQVAHKAVHPQTGDVTLRCQGFNHKNDYERQTPCDQDYLRKLSRDTDPKALLLWFNQDVLKVFREHRAFDPEGIFIGDGSYLFVPDDPRYEGSARLLFDEDNHPVDPAQKDSGKYQWRRCYKLVSLIHTNRQGEFFLYAGLAVLPGKAHECPVLYQLVEQFVETVGAGIMRRLLLDRAFLDGEAIGRCKQLWGIDVLIPLRKNMALYEDALGLLALPEISFQPFEPLAQKLPPSPRPQPERIRKREAARQKTLQEQKERAPQPPPEKILLCSEVAGIRGFESFSSCPVPLSVVINRETYADGRQELWMLLDTQEVGDPAEVRRDYGLRTAIEERHRQLKCFWDLSDFRSRALSLVVNQVVFVALAYSLLQLYLLRAGRKELNTKTRPRLRDQLLPSMSHVILYYHNCFAFLSALEYQELLLTLTEEARKKILAKTRRLRRELSSQLTHVRPP